MKCVNILILIFASAIFAHSQTNSNCPLNMVCISQEAANKAAENARLVPALQGKIAALEDALKLKDASIQELKDLNAHNVDDLKEAMHRTEVALAEKTGSLIGCEASNVRNMAIIDGLLKKRQVKVGLINF